MSHKHLHVLAGTLALVLTAFNPQPAMAQQAGATLDYVTPAGGGRCNIGGTALAANGNAACALALASGRCMFTCGPGSLRCEGGTANLPFGKFQLDNLPTETDGNIYLQVFVQGNISFTRRIPCETDGAQWRAVTDVCCPNGPLTYEVNIGGVTRRSIAHSCNSRTSDPFIRTSSGTKSYSSTAIAPACNFSGRSGGTVTMAPNTCYEFRIFMQGQNVVESFSAVSCSSSASADTQEESQATPMAIFPMQPTSDDSGSQNLVPFQKVNPQP
jgi:hypothetical protein